jgi:ABC-2 type transport system ATP-binding protein
LCRRVVFIDQGRVLFDGSTQEMIYKFGGHRYIVIEAEGWEERSWNGPTIARNEGTQLWFKINNDNDVDPLIRELSNLLRIQNLSVREPRIEDIMKQMYKE